MSVNPRIPSDTEHMVCPIPSNITINEFLNKCLQSMGSSKFFHIHLMITTAKIGSYIYYSQMVYLQMN